MLFMLWHIHLQLTPALRSLVIDMGRSVNSADGDSAEWIDPIVSPTGQRVLSHSGKYYHLDLFAAKCVY